MFKSLAMALVFKQCFAKPAQDYRDVLDMKNVSEVSGRVIRAKEMVQIWGTKDRFGGWESSGSSA